jgi:hypothetical protein
MKNCLLWAGSVLMAGFTTASGQSFTPGDLVVSTYGSTTSNTCLDGNPTPISLVEFSSSITAGSAPVFTLTLPVNNSGNNVGVVGEYGSFSEGNIQLSDDNQYLTIGGYDAVQAASGIGASSNAANGTNDPIGTPYSNNAGVPLGQSTDTDVSRVAVLIDSNGNMNSSTTFDNLYSTNNPGSVYSQNGSTIYISGQGSSTADQGLYYAQTGTQNQPTEIYDAYDTRFTQVYGGNLYYSIDKKKKVTGIFEYSGIPTSAANAAQITPAGNGSIPEGMPAPP